MTKLTLLSALGLVGSIMTAGACMPIQNQAYPAGIIYNGTTAPSMLDRVETSGAGKAGTKVGKACSTGILGVAAFGDASLDAAKRAGQITDVHSMEYEATAVLGFIYSQVCTVVHGN